MHQETSRMRVSLHVAGSSEEVSRRKINGQSVVSRNQLDLIRLRCLHGYINVRFTRVKSITIIITNNVKSS